MFYIRVAAVTTILLVSSSLLAADNSVLSTPSLQHIINKSDKTVTIALSDFAPTGYKVNQHVRPS